MSLSRDDRDAVRADAARYLSDRGFVTPPFPVDLALQSEQLRLADISLEAALRQVGLDPDEMKAVDAMLHVEGQLVVVRDDLHPQSKKWGAVHELSDFVLPAHRDLLFYCSLVELPYRVQKQLEMEADAFTSDLLFFGNRFKEEAFSSAIGMQVPIALASGAYAASLHSALRRYVEESPIECCLLVWKIEGDTDHPLALRYWVRSPSSKLTFRVRQKLSANHAVCQAFTELRRNPLYTVLPHNVTVGGRRMHAESFTNSYEVFTLCW